jgi:hypothetical protein
LFTEVFCCCHLSLFCLHQYLGLVCYDPDTVNNVAYQDSNLPQLVKNLHSYQYTYFNS